MDLPSKRVAELRRKITRFSNIIGADLPNPRLCHPRNLAVTIIGLATVAIIQFNGLYQAWPNILNICQALFFIPLILQLSSRSVNRFGLNDEAINLELQMRLEKFCKSHEMNLIYRAILTKKIDIYSSFINIYFLGYFIVIHSPFVGMVVSAAFTGSFQLMAPIYVPFVDPKELSGFIINAIIQLMFTEITFVSLIALDFQFLFYSYQICLMFDILTLKFKDFGHGLISQKSNSQKTFKNLVRKHFMGVKKVTSSIKTKEYEKKRLIQLIKEYYEITKFASLLFKEMKIPMFVTITSGGLALCLSGLTFLSYSIIIGCFGIFFYLTQIIITCILVTYVTHQNEQFSYKIYEFPWYMLSKSEQKTFLQFIQSCQNYEDLELPMIGKIDMELFTTVVNTGYSYFMFIWTFVEI